MKESFLPFFLNIASVIDLILTSQDVAALPEPLRDDIVAVVLVQFKDGALQEDFSLALI